MKDLIERLEAAPGPSRELDAEIFNIEYSELVGEFDPKKCSSRHDGGAKVLAPALHRIPRRRADAGAGGVWNISHNGHQLQFSECCPKKHENNIRTTPRRDTACRPLHRRTQGTGSAEGANQ